MTKNIFVEEIFEFYHKHSRNELFPKINSIASPQHQRNPLNE